MALYLLQPGVQPLGQFDFLDADLASCEGGMIGTLDEASRAKSASNKGAADAFDGYVADLVDVGTPDASRPILRLADTSTEVNKLFYLLDDGTAGYGTLFGQLIGNPVGQTFTGSALGPHTASGSGKVTAWDKPGLYGVSLAALDADVVPTSSGNLYDTPLPGELLYRGATTAKLTRSTASGDKMAMFVEVSGNRSLVTTPAKLVGAAEVFDRIVIQYLGAGHNA
jgi:hypothetical protein